MCMETAPTSDEGAREATVRRELEENLFGSGEFSNTAWLATDLNHPNAMALTA